VIRDRFGLSALRSCYWFHLPLIALSCIGPTRANAQTNICTEGLKEELFGRLINRQFTTVVSPQSGAILGNFAAIDLKEATASFAATTILPAAAVLATKVSGGAADGLLPVLRGQQFSSKVGATAQLHLLNRARRTLRWDAESCLQYEAIARRIDREHALRVVEISEGRNFARTLRDLQLRALEQRAETLTTNLNDTTLHAAQRDSLLVEQAKVTTTRELISSEPLPNIDRQRHGFDIRRAEQRRQAQDSIIVTGFSIGWLSLEYGVVNTEFRLFDSDLPAETQVAKRSFATHRGGVRYSRYHFSSAAYETRFWSVAALISQDHNLGDLAAVELTDRNEFGQPPAQRFTESKYTAYTGDYQSRLVKWTLNADFYQFLFHRNQAAVHIYPSTDFRDGQRPTYNLGLGFLMVARGLAKEPSTLNAELYYNLIDLTNTRESEDGLLRRGGLGLRLTFPITFRAEI
jgi:hypothetical protein